MRFERGIGMLVWQELMGFFMYRYLPPLRCFQFDRAENIYCNNFGVSCDFPC